MSFEINYDGQPLKFLKNQDKILIKRILDKIELLRFNPVLHDSKKIEGSKNIAFRIRVGNYRILYRINYMNNKISIFKIDKRNNVYK